jgi:Tol biopolymer transport system component
MTERMDDTRVDREIRAFLAWQSDDVTGAPSASEMAVRVRERVHGDNPLLPRSYQRQLALALLLATLLAMLLGAAAFIGGSLPRQPMSVQNGWIAISSQPGYRQTFETDWAEGGDIYLVREGVEPHVIVDRGPSMTRNVCPQFSPDGSKLVYGELDGTAAALVLLEIGDGGGASEWRRLHLPGVSSDAPCPRWTRAGTHIAYLSGLNWADGQADTSRLAVNVVDLSGAPVTPTEEDPTTEDLLRSGTLDPLDTPDGPDPLLSPDGAKRAACTDDGILIEQANGSPPHRVLGTRLCGYSLAAWSPDGSRVVMLSDGGRHATMSIASVAGPMTERHIAPNIPVNGSRSWPGRGDVSWQPVYP